MNSSANEAHLTLTLMRRRTSHNKDSKKLLHSQTLLETTKLSTLDLNFTMTSKGRKRRQKSSTRRSWPRDRNERTRLKATPAT